MEGLLLEGLFDVVFSLLSTCIIEDSIVGFQIFSLTWTNITIKYKQIIKILTYSIPTISVNYTIFFLTFLAVVWQRCQIFLLRLLKPKLVILEDILQVYNLHWTTFFLNSPNMSHVYPNVIWKTLRYTNPLTDIRLKVLEINLFTLSSFIINFTPLTVNYIKKVK